MSQVIADELPANAVNNESAQVSGAPAWGTRLNAWLENASDFLNPILVKETRQALKSQQFALWFMLLLGACWVVTIGGVALIGPSVYYAATGGMLYRAYFVILAFPLLVVVPFSAFRSLSAEQEENTRDLLMVSALSPRQIINGKLGSALLQMLVYLSAIAPCLAFTYLLRGIDLITVVLLPVCALVLSLTLSMMGLLLASLSKQRFAQVLFSVLMIGFLFWSFYWSTYVAFEIIDDGYRIFADEDFWIGALATLNLFVTFFAMIYFAAVGLNTFIAANRSTPLRVMMFIQQACFMGWMAWGWVVSKGELGILAGGIVVLGLYWFAMGSLLTGEMPVLSNRVRRGLPSTAVGRMLFTWFNPGPGTGYFFSLANLIASCGLLAFAAGWTRNGQYKELLAFTGLGICYIAIFLGVGRLLVAGARKIAEVSLLGCFLIHFLLVLGSSSLPLLIPALFGRNRPTGLISTYVISPGWTLSRMTNSMPTTSELMFVTLVVGGTAVIVLLVNLLITAKEIRQTRTPIPKRVIEDELVLHPAPEAKVKNPWGDT